MGQDHPTRETMLYIIGHCQANFCVAHAPIPVPCETARIDQTYVYFPGASSAARAFGQWGEGLGVLPTASGRKSKPRVRYSISRPSGLQGITPVLTHGLEHGQNILHRRASLDVMHRRKNEPSSGTENLDALADLAAYVVRSSKGEC